MTLFAFIALLGWIPFTVMLFALVPARKAAAIAVVGAWLVLPPYSLNFAALPDYSKITAAALGLMLGSLIFDPLRILNFRPRWFDTPMLLYCLSGLFSSLQNGLGPYDGLAEVLKDILGWGLPYLFGRLYFSDPEGLRLFTFAMVIGGLSYVLPCLWEMRMSPHLLRNIYGTGMWQGERLGGYRPNVFFRTGLELGMWMTAASLTAWWLWWCGVLKKIGQIPFGRVLLPIQMATTILCRSTGALFLLIAGMMFLWLSARLKTRLLLASLLLVGPVYVAVRVSKIWSGQQAVDLIETYLGHERAYSLEYRFMCEDLLVVKAVEQPILGWGGWGRSAVYRDPDKPWRRMVETDGLWIIILGARGFFGLTSLYLAFVLPAALFIWRFPVRLWSDPRLASGTIAAVLLGLYMVDCLMNGFPNIIYITLAGGLAGIEAKQLQLVAPGSGTQAVRRASSADQLALAERNCNMGRALKAEGRLKEAEAVWKQSLNLLGELRAAYPNNPDLQQRCCDCANDLVWLWVNYDTGRSDLKTAVAIAQWIVEECPDAAIYWNTLGVAQYRAGNYASAITALDRATTLGGTTPFNEVFLAMAYARSGGREESELRLAQAISQVRQDYPEHSELSRFCDEARFMLAEGTEKNALSFPELSRNQSHRQNNLGNGT